MDQGKKKVVQEEHEEFEMGEYIFWENYLQIINTILKQNLWRFAKSSFSKTSLSI